MSESTSAIDSQRLALIGYSYGGRMAGFAAGKTHTFVRLSAESRNRSI